MTKQVIQHDLLMLRELRELSKDHEFLMELPMDYDEVKIRARRLLRMEIERQQESFMNALREIGK